jgi:membrane associated rhomboid family serine protease
MFPLRDINPTRTRPYVNWALIVLNSLFFLYELSLGQGSSPFSAPSPSFRRGCSTPAT